MQVGLSATSSVVVTDADTAVSLGSGDVPVLGTPRVVALAEQATVAAVAGQLDTGTTSVGTRVDLEHLRPSPVGSTVAAQATLTAVEGRLLTFDVSVSEGDVEVARGKISRVIVDRDRFMTQVDHR